ncbi:MAG: alpha/beta hydrolase [Maritimibacter sp.]|nr:alpha/beta hydrolase [Maritimibacter sp.]
MKRALKWVGGAVAALVLAAAILPLVMPVRPLTGLVPVAALAGPEDRFVTLPFDGTDGIDIRYREAGAPDAPCTLVLLHGSVFNAETWDAVMAPLSEDCRVVAYDQAPYGLSEKLLPGTWTGPSPYAPEAAVARVTQLMDALGIGRAVLVGNSYGANLAVQAAAAAPDRVAGLVLADAAVYVDENMPGWLMRLPQVERLGPLLARGIGGSERFIRQTWADPERMDPDRMDKTLIHTRAEGWDLALWAYLQSWTMPPLDGALAGLSLPVLVLTGDSDAVIPVADSRRLSQAIAGADYVELPGCGHVPQEECPAVFAAAVRDWLADLGPES